MKHSHPRWQFWWHYRCAPCKLKQIGRVSKKDPYYQDELKEIKNRKVFSYWECEWLLEQLGEK